MVQLYNKLPSELLGIEDGYTAFCFNEACAFIMTKINKEELPVFDREEVKEQKPKHYSNFKDLYNQIEGRC